MGSTDSKSCEINRKEEILSTSLPTKEIKICVTGGAGQISYSLLPWLCNGSIFKEAVVDLHLLDIPFSLEALKGVRMELQDSGFPKVRNVLVTTSAAEAFAGVDVAVLVGGYPRKQGMTRADLLAKNAEVMKEHGEAIEKYASRNIRIVVVTNPANTNALLVLHYAPSIPRKNVTCLTRLDHERLHGFLVEKLREKDPLRFVDLGPERIRNGIIWGNHSSTQVPDASHAEVCVDKKWLSVRELIGDEAWLNDTLAPCVQNRGAAIIEARKLSSAMSAAFSIKKHLENWLFGTKEGEYVSMGVLSNDNPYGINANLMFSFPVCCEAGSFTIVSGLSGVDVQKVKSSEAELEAEKKCIEDILNQQLCLDTEHSQSKL